MTRLINELFLRMESHIGMLQTVGTFPDTVSDLKLFLLMAGDMAIQLEDLENPPAEIEVSEEKAIELGLIESTHPRSEPREFSNNNNTGQYL